ncbi:M15 family metallopeptidase [Croceiramulus getboli]|nr:M15 family metallopeptidase [Flavobacteriaceae bacterium YJPT1-3]
MRFFNLIIILSISYCGWGQDSSAIDESKLINIATLDTLFAYDVRYATANNFLEQAVYDCERCYLLPEVAKALAEANHYFCELGYRIVLFDCYRPLSVQKKMWEIYPNPGYVGNPYGSGSVHNRGAAVDLSLVTLDGDPVDMGTDYDYFGKEAHIDYTGHSDVVNANRKLLWDGLAKFGFTPIRTEWWHVNYKVNYSLPVLDYDFDCNNN